MSDLRDNAWHQLPGWTDAFTGLRWYFRALVAYCILMGITVLFGVFVAMARSEGALTTMVLVTGSLGIAVQVFALIGLSKYANVPAASKGRGLAKAAFVISVVMFIIGLVLFIKQLGELDQIMRNAGKTDPWTLLTSLGNIAMLILFLMSMGRVSAFIERYEIQKLIGTTLTLLGGLVALGFLVGVVATASPGAIGFVLIIALLLLGLAIWMLVNVMMIVYRLSKAIEADVDVSRAFD